MTGLLYTHFHDNINFLNNPSYLKSEKPVCCINFLQQLTLYRLSLIREKLSMPVNYDPYVSASLRK